MKQGASGLVLAAESAIGINPIECVILKNVSMNNTKKYMNKLDKQLIHRQSIYKNIDSSFKRHEGIMLSKKLKERYSQSFKTC